jgi:hypothetical protein
VCRVGVIKGVICSTVLWKRFLEISRENPTLSCQILVCERYWVTKMWSETFLVYLVFPRMYSTMHKVQHNCNNKVLVQLKHSEIVVAKKGDTQTLKQIIKKAKQKKKSKTRPSTQSQGGPYVLCPRKFLQRG